MYGVIIIKSKLIWKARPIYMLLRPWLLWEEQRKRNLTSSVIQIFTKGISQPEIYYSMLWIQIQKRVNLSITIGFFSASLHCQTNLDKLTIKYKALTVAYRLERLRYAWSSGHTPAINRQPVPPVPQFRIHWHILEDSAIRIHCAYLRMLQLRKHSSFDNELNSKSRQAYLQGSKHPQIWRVKFEGNGLTKIWPYEPAAIECTECYIIYRLP